MIRNKSDKNPDIPSKVAKWKKGDKLTAKKFNETTDAVNRLMGGIRPPRQIRGNVGSGPLKLQAFEVIEALGDHINCKKIENGSPIEGSIFVAKPPLLRRTPFDPTLTEGAVRDNTTFEYHTNIKRTATTTNDDDEEITEVQVHVPSYVEGDIIYGIQSATGGTGVTVANASGEPTTVQWLDMNVDGRAWARANDQDDLT